MAELAQVLDRLGGIDGKLDQLIEDVSSPPRGSDPGGLLYRMRDSERAQTQVAALIAQLRVDVDALKAEPGRRAVSFADWFRLAVAGLHLSGVAGLVGSQIGGRHP
jgi:hypothetical protein